MDLRRSKTASDGNYSVYQLLTHIEDIDTNAIMDDYMNLRNQVANVNGNPLFLRPSTKRYGYDSMAIGKNQFSTMSVRMAKTLGKPNPETYTSHTFRRSCATALVEGGATAEELKIIGNWKSIQVPTAYVNESSVSKVNILRTNMHSSPKKNQRQQIEGLSFLLYGNN